MRIVGKRTEQQIEFHASAEKLAAGAVFNDETLKILGKDNGFYKKGVYHYKTHEDANKDWEDNLINSVIRKHKNGK